VIESVVCVMRRTLCALLVLLAVIPLPLKAQAKPQVQPGDRVRVTAPRCGLEKTAGRLLSIDGERFSATLGGEDIDCPIQALTRLEVSLGERKPWKPTLVGVAIGVGIGAIGVAAILPSGEETWDDLGPAAMWAMASITVGAVAGNVIGRKWGTDHWEEVLLPLVQPSVLFLRDGRLGFGFSVPIRR